MVEVGGRKLISHQLEAIERAGFGEVVVVVGHGATNLMQYIGSSAPQVQVQFVENRDFSTTNNIYSLHLALQACGDRNYSEFAIFESDVYVDASTAQAFLTDPAALDSALVSPYEYWMDGTAVTVNTSGRIDAFVSKKDISRYGYGELYKTVNWYRFSRHYLHRLLLTIPCCVSQREREKQLLRRCATHYQPSRDRRLESLFNCDVSLDGN